MPLAAGARLGPFEILGPLGAGSMGEVYRARDSRLGREVAIKVLPPAFAEDPVRLNRFEQEARATAALNHPNILTVYDVSRDRGSAYIVSELLEGQTLRDHLQSGPIPIRRAVDYAVQIAQGLAAAHEKGILHRDLKPENVFITSAGRVKILDFGLAKLSEPMPLANVGSVVPTTPGTEPGLVLGTVGYMAPEQVRGLPADHRSDIFSFGAILYEMITGRPPFRRDTAADTMSAILKDEPPEPPADRHVPPGLLRIALRCLEKSPAMRFQSTEDLAFALPSALSTDAGTPVHEEIRVRRAGRPALVVAALVAAMGLGLWFGARLRRPAPQDDLAVRLSFAVPPNLVVTNDPMRVSPDGTRIVFAALNTTDGVRRLWIRPLDALDPYGVMETELATQPFWSPDSRSVGFFANGQLKRVDLATGTVTTITAAPQAAGGAWNQNDVIVFSSERQLRRVAASGGEPVNLPGQNGKAADGSLATLANPVFLPDGRHLLYLDTGPTAGLGEATIYAAALDSPDRTPVLKGASSNVWYAAGYLFYLRDTTFVAQPFDMRSFSVSGMPLTITDEVQKTPAGVPVGQFSVSDAVLAYRSGAGTRGFQTQLQWFDRDGKKGEMVGDVADYADVKISGDGTQALVSKLDPGTGRDLWIFDLRRGVPTRLTNNPADEYPGVWSPDGASVIFGSRVRGHFDLYRKPVSGSASDEPVLIDDKDKYPMSWVGDTLLFSTGTLAAVGNRAHLSAMSMSGDRKAYAVLDDANFTQYPGQLSPDGRWIAYASNESGQTEVYIASFPDLRNRVRVSTDGGSWPRWSRDGREVYFLPLDNSRLLAAPLTITSGNIMVERVRQVLEIQNGEWRVGARYPYDIAPDGRILAAVLVERPTAAPITVLVNWASALKK